MAGDEPMNVDGYRVFHLHHGHDDVDALPRYLWLIFLEAT
jgi:hypothetical protein